MLLNYVFLIVILFHQGYSYNALEDERIIRAFLSQPDVRPTDHAKVARELVHKANWAATGTISTDKQVLGFPMVNIISIADSGLNKPSTGVIYFMLTTLDFTGQDIQKNNKITLMVSNDEDLECSKANTDPMEPTCARAIFSGKVTEMNEDMEDYKFGMNSFISRHPAANKWINAHTFKLCKLDIENIYVLDWYGGPHNVSPQDYYKANLNDNKLTLKMKTQLLRDLDWAATNFNKQHLTINIPKNRYQKVNLKF